MTVKKALEDMATQYHEAVWRLSCYVTDVARAIESLRKDRGQILERLHAARDGRLPVEPAGTDEKTVKLELTKEDVDVLIEVVGERQGHVEGYPDLAFQMAFVNLVALFDAFLKDVFFVVLTSNPATLKSSRSVSYDRVLEYESMAELIDYLAARDLHEVGYKSIPEQIEYYEKRFAITCLPPGTDVGALVEVRAIRNLIVHNNGVVNHRFLEEVPASSHALGERILVDESRFLESKRVLEDVVGEIVKNLIAKFGQ